MLWLRMKKIGGKVKGRPEKPKDNDYLPKWKWKITSY